MTKIKEITLKKIKNSRGKDTIQATVKTHKTKATASAPQGTSEGTYEAVFMPKKIEMTIQNAYKKLIPKLIGESVQNQEQIDEIIKNTDGTKNYSNVGASVSISISSAAIKAAANESKRQLWNYINPHAKTLPIPMGKCIGGGAHSNVPSPEIQEFLSIPIAATFRQAVKTNRIMHKNVKKMFANHHWGPKHLDYEGGWTPNINSITALNVMNEAINKTAPKTNNKIRIGIDVAATQLYKNKQYHYKHDAYTAKQQMQFMQKIAEEFNIKYIEDPFHEEDFRSHAELTKKIGKSCLITGDDLFTTNEERLRKGIKQKACNAIIIKPNQIGTITQAYETVKLAKKHGYTPIMSHRSGETKDALIAHLAVAWECPIIKIGIIGKERTSKTDELKGIENRNKLKISKIW